MFEKAGDIMGKVVNQRGLGKTARASQVCFEAEKILTELFPKYASRVSVESFNKGVLKISASSASLNQEIQFKKDELIKKINAKIGQKIVESIRFSLKA